jgi:hypothetical protein
LIVIYWKKVNGANATAANILFNRRDKDSSLVQIYWTQTGGLICLVFMLQLKESDTCINK